MVARRIPHQAVLLLAAVALGCDRQGPVAPARPVNRSTLAFGDGSRHADRVLLISVDGLHALDLSRYVAGHPASTLARLSHRGVTFTNASASKPSDSYRGLLAQITGGSPRSTGVYYDDSYDRALSPPGSGCATVGTEVVYDESIDKDLTRLDGGGGIDPMALPLDPKHGCTPVYPHQFLRVNTVFEVIKAAGLRTAWSDKHPSYELVKGPSGQGVDDLFSPEIAATLPNGGVAADNVANCISYDRIKVQAILNEIDGKDHSGTVTVGVPAIFGMNFQAVSVGEKTKGYLDASGTPSPDLATALDFVDESLGQMVAELQAQGLFESTLIIVSAKHGQAPINPALRRIVDKHLVPNIVNGAQPGLIAQATEDDIALVWLSDQTKTGVAVGALAAHQTQAGISSILSGNGLAAMFDDPRTDSRTPDVIVVPELGVIYTGVAATKVAEHGGFSHDDTNVPILVSAPGFTERVATDYVETRQIAPTILVALGLNPTALRAVQLEGTAPLPVFDE